MDGDWDPYHLLGLPYGASPAAAVEVHGQLVTAAEAVGADSSLLDAALRAVVDQEPQADPPCDKATCDGGAATETKPVDPEPEERTKSAGWPITFGAPASGLARSGFDPAAILAGTAGEVEVAAWIDASALAADAFVCHSVTPSGGSGDVDHVVIRGDLLLLVDAKRWAPGRYESMQTTTGMVATRDGQPFPAGTVPSIGFLGERLRSDLGWKGRVQRVIAVSSSGAPARPVNLDGYRHPEAIVITADQLPALLDRLLATAVPSEQFASTVRELAARTNSPAVRSPLAGPAGPSNPPLDPRLARAMEPAPPDLDPLPAEAKKLAGAYGVAVSVALVLALALPDMPHLMTIAVAAVLVWLGWQIWSVFVELENEVVARSGLSELSMLRCALMLDPAIPLRAIGIPSPRSARVATAGLGASLGGIWCLLFLRSGSWLDLSHLAVLAVIAGVLVLGVAVLVLLPSDIALTVQTLHDRPHAWVEAVEGLRVANARAAAVAMAVAAQYPNGLLVDYLARFVMENDLAAVALGAVGLSVASRVDAPS